MEAKSPAASPRFSPRLEGAPGNSNSDLKALLADVNSDLKASPNVILAEGTKNETPDDRRSRAVEPATKLRRVSQPDESEFSGPGVSLMPLSFPAKKHLESYAQNLKKVEKSKTRWLSPGLISERYTSGENYGDLPVATILEELVQEKHSLDGGVPETAASANLLTTLFTSEAQKQQFEAGYAQLLRKNLSRDQLEELKNEGRSNGYKLQFGLLELPPGASYPLHAHATLEVAVALVGTCHELRCPAELPFNEMHMGGILDLQAGDTEYSNAGDTDTETYEANIPNLQKAVSEKVEFPDKGAVGQFSDGVFAQAAEVNARGEIITPEKASVNQPGSVHLSYTEAAKGTILFVLWSGAHANILAHNFKQRTGVDLLVKKLDPRYCEECEVLRQA